MSEHVKSFAAVDLGASSGRVMVGRVGPEALELTEAHRFPNRPVRVPEGLRWDILSLYAGVLDGLRAAGQVDSVGIDSWAVDYGLLDADGALLGNPVHYRDARTEGVAEKVWATVPAAELYATTGLQYAPFNTLYQLTAARSTAQLEAAERLLLVPDLLAYWLTGEAGTEVTNASTTQLIDPRTRDWSHDLADRLGIDLTLFAPLRQPGDPAGLLLPRVLEETGLRGPVPVTTVGSHDTASAVAASRHLAHLRLVLERRSCADHWADRLRSADLLAAGVRGDAAFLAPGRMPDRITDACRESGQPVPESRAEITRCILDSLALAHRRAIREAEALADHPVDVVHIVGGGTRNELLCQLTADACGLPVVVKPGGGRRARQRPRPGPCTRSGRRPYVDAATPRPYAAVAAVRAPGRRGGLARRGGPAHPRVNGNSRPP
nr:FGGY family carbohydrate kinase [Streptomyces sp. S1D4-11]